MFRMHKSLANGLPYKEPISSNSGETHNYPSNCMFQKEQIFAITHNYSLFYPKKDMNCPFTGIHYYLRLFYRFCKILLFKYLKNHSYSFSIIIYLTNSLEKCPRIMDTTKLSIYSKNWISILYLTSLSLFPFIVGFL